MDEAHFTLWTEGAWRCEYWMAGGKGELRLYHDATLQRTHLVAGGEPALLMSREWRSLVLRNSRQPNQ